VPYEPYALRTVGTVGPRGDERKVTISSGTFAARSSDRTKTRLTNRELHRIRIRAKRSRYAAEAFAPVAGRTARTFAERMKRLQDLLGEQHDAVVNEQRLCHHRQDIRLAFVAGELFALEGSAADSAPAVDRRLGVRSKEPIAVLAVNSLAETAAIGRMGAMSIVRESSVRDRWRSPPFRSRRRRGPRPCDRWR
jgi:hypothetical protein